MPENIFTGQWEECYIFNPKLLSRYDDGACEHCIKYLTNRCPHIAEFVEDETDY